MQKQIEQMFFVSENRIEYMLGAVNVLRNSLKNLYLTKRGFFQFNILQSDQ